MEAMTAGGKLFNSPLETGLRLVVILEQLHPRACSVAELVWFDFLAVHSASIGGPPSIHPDLPASSGELVVRRGVIEQALRLMQRVHLIEERVTEGGLRFSASDDTPSFVSTLQATYFEQLKQRGEWIAERFREATLEDLQSQMSAQVGWSIQFTFPSVG